MTPRTPVLIELPAAVDAAERLLALQAGDPDFYPAFLDSAATGGTLGRFSLLLAAPGSRLQLDRRGYLAGPGLGDGFCARLNAWWREERGPPPPAPWPFAGGWFLYLGYELAGEIEPTLELPASPLEPVACAVRISRSWKSRQPSSTSRRRISSPTRNCRCERSRTGGRPVLRPPPPRDAAGSRPAASPDTRRARRP